MASRQPLITLTSDFGTSGHFVAAMKGVILSICPAARIVDITHDLKPFEVTEAAFTFGEAWRWFPKGTIHAAIVDPGVGSARRPILAEAAGHFFIAPDNGLLTSALNLPKAKVREITATKLALPTISNTFHGRDIFAPAAAHLAAGVRPAAFGKLIADALRLKLDKPAQTSKRQWSGTILAIDHFGNVITNFHTADFPWVTTNPFAFTVGYEQVPLLARHYAECEYGELYAVPGSSGYFEIILREANAAKRLGVAAGAPVELTGWAKEN